MSDFMKGFLITGAIAMATVLGVGIWKAVTSDLTEEEQELINKLTKEAFEEENKRHEAAMKSLDDEMKQKLEENEKELDKQMKMLAKWQNRVDRRANELDELIIAHEGES